MPASGPYVGGPLFDLTGETTRAVAVVEYAPGILVAVRVCWVMFDDALLLEMSPAARPSSLPASPFSTCTCQIPGYVEFGHCVLCCICVEVTPSLCFCSCFSCGSC